MEPQDGDGALRYAEFVSGLLYVNAKVSAVETARLTFRLFDKVRAQRPNVELQTLAVGNAERAVSADM